MANSDFIINGSELTKYVGTDRVVVIPKGVTAIGSSAFAKCYDVVSVSIPYGVTSIGENAFWACKSLTVLVVPASVKAIGNGAFQGCLKLSSVTLPIGLKNIGRTAFEGVPCKIVRQDVVSASSKKSTVSTPTSRNYSKRPSTTASSVNKSKESSDKNESIIDRFNKAIEKEPSYAKRAATTKSDSYVKTTASATKTTKTPAKPACDVSKANLSQKNIQLR